MNTIVLATDGSPSAAEAVGTAIELAKATGWRLHVVVAWQVPPYQWGYPPLNYVPELTRSLREHAQDVVAAVEEAARDEGIDVTSRIVEGDPAALICTAASEHDAELIVIGSHGWSALRRFVFGSVSSTVLHEAPCPVLVVRGVVDDAKSETVAVGRAGTV